PTDVERAIVKLDLPTEVAALARNRAALIAENRLYQTELGNQSPGSALSPEQLARLRASQAESSSRALAAQLEMDQLERQLRQTQVELADAKQQLTDDRKVLAEIEQRNEKAIAEAEKP
uniref:hypothetical protein n=1 Tax=Cyanothece sp. BG0011 TaxID=2082950 RepID=UPI0030D6DB30